MTELHTSDTGNAPDVFVSYCRHDRAQVERIVHALELEGLDIWWDRRLDAGVAFDEEIAVALRHAECVLVCWSRAAVASEWVRAESADGRERGVLVSCKLEKCSPYPPFNILHDEDLSNWRGDVDDARWRRLSAAVADCRAGRPRGTGPISVRPRLGQPWPRALAAACGVVAMATLLAFMRENTTLSDTTPYGVRSPEAHSAAIGDETFTPATSDSNAEALEQTDAAEMAAPAPQEALAVYEAADAEVAAGETEDSSGDDSEHVQPGDPSPLATLVEHIGLRADSWVDDAAREGVGASGVLDEAQ